MPGPYGTPGPRQNRGQAPETVTVNGTLGFSDGYISLKQDDITYYVLGLGQLIGFVDGLKEGARVNLEGYTFSPQRDTKTQFLWVEKLTFNGREYKGLSFAFRESEPGERQRQLPPNMHHYHHYL
jgi:hypothetical protein